jgi:raffinose/stachyose/melibiose transport system substrate-binding protein
MSNKIASTFKNLLKVTIAAAAIFGIMQAAPAKAATTSLVIESWRTDDAALWDKIIAKFKETNPDIDVKFQPTNPPDYNAALSAKLQSGTAGDLITCRPFDAGYDLYQKGYLTDVSKLPGIEHFNAFARNAWTSPDGVTYCVPMASVLHGFIYNKDYFDKNGFKEPATYEDFLALLAAIKKEGSMAPLAIGTKEGWTTTSMGFDNIGPNFWGGDDGRKGLIAGTRKYNDAGFVAAFNALSQWAPFLPQGHEAIAYADTQGLFTSGKAAIFPAGSWEIAGFEKDADFKMGAFKAPPPAANNGKCYISDELDIAIGVNKNSKNADAATKFLQFVTSQDFASMYAGGLPGFYSLSDYKLTMSDPLSNTFLSWRAQCGSTLRSSYQALNSNADHPTENNLWNVTSQLLQGKLTPQQAGDTIQADLDKWYKPAGAAATMAPTMAATAAK